MIINEMQQWNTGTEYNNNNNIPNPAEVGYGNKMIVLKLFL
jgi:hypothetical protein